MLNKFLAITTILALAGTVACGADSKDTVDKKDQSKKEDGGSTEVNVPSTPEEGGPVVVDESGNSSPIDPGDGNGNESGSPAGITPCDGPLCFNGSNWAISKSGTYIQIKQNTDNPATNRPILVLDGFQNPSLSKLQSICLSQTARALNEFLTDRADALDSFVEKGVNTAFEVRVYDTSKVTNKVNADLYFIKGTGEAGDGKELSLGKWVIRSAIKGVIGTDDCQILTPEQIATKFDFWKTKL